ncbi:MAG: pyruvate kinase [Clostridiales bacterium]|nr:pyruvate kinase [Clostridiales bacterium]
MKKTKIICTIGPASTDKETLSKMADAGMDIVRLNFSHGNHEDFAKKIALIKEVREEKNLPLPILLDTKGPEFRIKTFKDGKISLKKGDSFTFTSEDIIGDETKVSVSYVKICEEMVPGDKILLNNGMVVFRVTEVKAPNVHCIVEIGGELSNRKSMFFPDKELHHMEFLSEQDKADLLFGIQQDVDFVALSFVSKAQDVIDVKEFLKANGGKDIDVIAKIENRAGVNHLLEIMKVSDGIMVARGDLGVEIPYVELPNIQKHIISECRIHGKRVITATEMLESMIHNPRPTRAEISDVANAVYDGTSAVMLSGETAAGNFPVESVNAMAKIVEHAEEHIEYIQTIDNFEIETTSEALSHSAATLAKDLHAKAIVVCTRTGGTARKVSRFRPNINIIGITTDIHAYRQLALSWGVLPVMTDEYTSIDILFYFAKEIAKRSGLVQKGDTIVITGGTPNGKSGNSNLINVETI